MTSLVHFASVSRVFNAGTTTAALDLSFDISPLARIALIGRSGSGKTTILNLVAGLDHPTKGEVTWPGLTVPLRPTQIAVAFQGLSLIPWLTIEENVALALQVSDQIANQKLVADALSRFDVDKVGRKLPEEVSGGQAQRVALARAIVTRPKLLLADEPSGQLDRPTADRTIEALLSWADEAGAGLLVATHDPEIAGALQTIWSLDHGRLVEIPR